MFEKILFPTDFSEFAQKTLSCVTAIPGVKEVVLLHLIDATHYSLHGWTHEQELKNARLLMEEKKAHLETRGQKAGTFVEAIINGTIDQRILEIAEQEKVSLTIIGTNQTSSLDFLLHHMNSHVLIVQPDAPECHDGTTHEVICPGIFSKVLVPVDFTEKSMDLLTIVRDMSGIGELVLEHVVTQGETEQEIEHHIQHARNELAKIQKNLEQAGLKAAVHIRVGNSVEKIISLADEEDVSMILMCAHKKNWIEEFLQGSTPFLVVRSSKIPVMILRI
ncbi:MAG: universal stress protein [Methanoregula sp.]|nr:universal stress protein [Methanoregula sp.]